MSEYTQTQPAAQRINLSKIKMGIVIALLIAAVFIAGNTYPKDTAKAAEPTPAQLAEQAKKDKEEAEKKAAIADKKAQAYQLLDEAAKQETPDQAEAPKK